MHTVVQVRIQYQQPTRDYLARRTTEGKTRREIKRCLARYSPETSIAYSKGARQLLDEA